MRKILIVDDDADFSEAMCAFLRAHHYDVVRAASGAEGLKLARIERPDLVLMDIMMNERTEGFFTVQAMRRAPELAAVPIFVLTSLYEKAPDFRVAPETGWLAHDEFFGKPVDPSQLLRKIQRRIGGGA